MEIKEAIGFPPQRMNPKEQLRSLDFCSIYKKLLKFRYVMGM